MTTIRCLEHAEAAPCPARQTWAARLPALWPGWVQRWRESARLRAELRALDGLDGLDDRTLHDIGLAERRLGPGLPGEWRDLPGAWRDPRNCL